MKEWYILLDVIDSFVYDFDEEKIVFNDSSCSLAARKMYESYIKTYDISGNEKWAFDIALDCVRNMKSGDREYLKESCEVDFFGYGLYIRNKYIHCAKRHHGFFGGDHQCSVVLSFIYTILHRYYNRFNKQLCVLLQDFDYKSICKLYSDKYPFIEEETLKLTQPDCVEDCKTVLKRIKERIRTELGRNGFKDIFISVVKECGKDCLAPQPWLDFVNKLYDRSPAYIKEYHQVQALKEIGLIRELTTEYPINKLSCVEDCKNYIDENIGFKDEDAQLLAETMWEAFKI